jgi:hypothetical protein
MNWPTYMIDVGSLRDLHDGDGGSASDDRRPLQTNNPSWVEGILLS